MTVIAPEMPGLAPLGWIREIGGISRPGVQIAVTGGLDVNEDRASEALRSGADLVIWSGHGMENGLALSNGAVVSGRWIAAQVRAAPPRALVLAACGSGVKDDQMRSLAAAVSRAGVHVVGFPLRIPDECAIAYNVEFVRAMAGTWDVGEAHEVALERVAVRWPEWAREIDLTPGLTDGLRAVTDRLDTVEREQRRQWLLLQAIAGTMGIDVTRAVGNGNG